MKNGPLFILGLFAALAVSFGGIVLGSHSQLGRLTPFFDDTEAQSYPLRSGGLAARGQLVYTDLGCASCHTQQVRRPDYGSDQARGWGERQSVARDYIHQTRPQLGSLRVGPDLANYGRRAGSSIEAATTTLDSLLYHGSATHPAYPFLFETMAVSGERSSRALTVSGGKVRAGEQVIPGERARTLVAFLLSLNTGYDYPEARPFVAAAPSGEAKGEQKK